MTLPLSEVDWPVWPYPYKLQGQDTIRSCSEKEQYPFHKVCGEYISLESWNFLQDLGVPLSDMQLPLINRVLISSPNGRFVESNLPLGDSVSAVSRSIIYWQALPEGKALLYWKTQG